MENKGRRGGGDRAKVANAYIHMQITNANLQCALNNVANVY